MRNRQFLANGLTTRAKLTASPLAILVTRDALHPVSDHFILAAFKRARASRIKVDCGMGFVEFALSKNLSHCSNKFNKSIQSEKEQNPVTVDGKESEHLTLVSLKSRQYGTRSSVHSSTSSSSPLHEPLVHCRLRILLP